MKYLNPTPRARLNEAVAVVLLFAGLFLLLSLASYNPFDPSWDTAASGAPTNLGGRLGALLANLLLQMLGVAAYTVPALILFLGYQWIRSVPITSTWAKILGAFLIIGASCTAFGFASEWRPIADALPAGGVLGLLSADALRAQMNTLGAAGFTAVCWILGLYLVSTFEMAKLAKWLHIPENMRPQWLANWKTRWQNWRKAQAEGAQQRAKLRVAQREQRRREKEEEKQEELTNPLRGLRARKAKDETPALAQQEAEGDPPIVDPLSSPFVPALLSTKDRLQAQDIPIHELQIRESPAYRQEDPPFETQPHLVKSDFGKDGRAPQRKKRHSAFRLPSTTLLQEAPPRSAFDTQELKDTAVRIKAKFEEFNVRGSVTQINPGPVVTTFEYKPEAGMKYSRITTLTEDLCLGLQAESILIERIPGKPTIGIEVPNSKREVISLRQILESEEFLSSPSPLTVALGKDINGRIKVAALDTMPHLLIAGSTGSGKSVMLNSLIMSVLYKATPDQVRLIMVDPKRLEFGLYEGIPHLLTPVITDSKKATNALRNAVLEMERRLKLLAAQGVRNIDQYNKKVRGMQVKPRSLFEDENNEEVLEPIPYILILIDELADLMMLERSAVEETVTRLAQMARAVGMHLVLATQRPSVDVITGLIKANFPSRISFRVATRVDSRTVLDVMGAEHLLGKGDMLFLPPGSSRLTRVHGSYVSEAETNDVVEFWKQQAEPDYDQTFLLAPPSDDEDDAEAEMDGPEDALYQDAVRVVLEMGKASTSTLQRRLRLGYGRAARILDMMQREGIIGPPDGSRPRDVLKRPDWLSEVESQLK